LESTNEPALPIHNSAVPTDAADFACGGYPMSNISGELQTPLKS
jgi:hypothetical protein